MAEAGTDTSVANDRYKWIALSNTTLGVFMSALDGSIVIISLPAIFRGIHLDPLAPGNISYLLWMITGYLLVQAVSVPIYSKLADTIGRKPVILIGIGLLRDEIHDQVTRSIALGARLLTGGVVPDRPGAWYPPTVLASGPIQVSP